ncbi:ATP-binding protein [Streptomyces sp. H27-C3]|uniref:ATP-binding protein n=1 Tax=Streptomyces sp. H27-C3 TaxID=3046305 RepID=UPI0024B8B8A2|nr:ATP-binding protein [Streptomyces sp. H27-C3]MDJ0462277.1 ATP-binding protein [Streptomyces sp. H27-C3]
MDPIIRGPEEYGHENDHLGESSAGDDARRPPRDALTADFGEPSPTLVRTVQLVSGDLMLTVNPVDGSEIEACPPGERPPRPSRHGADDRAELLRASRPPIPAGPDVPERPLLERQEERERLRRLLARGRSVRLTGPPGSGRTALLDAVAGDCADLAPDAVVRLSGHRRTPGDLLHELFAAVYSAPLHRPDRAELLDLVHDIGAVVVLDDLEFGGTSLDELLDATPECAFLLATTPDTAAPSPHAHIEEVLLAGLGRASTVELLERAVDRPLTDDEANWAGDLWFESEGLPLRFVQAGALLVQRDMLRADPNAFDEYGYFTEQPVDAPLDAADGHDVPLPTLAEGAAPARLLASRLSESARATLRFALALGGEVPHQAHLPALVGDTHADAALGELMSCGLLSPVGARHRLAAGVALQLESAGYADDLAERAHAAAQHYAWWAGHPSVTPERAATEADAVLAAMTAMVPGAGSGHPSAGVLLARTAAPAFAAGLCWGAWERSLRIGQEAARIAGEVAEEAYFHHELGVLALCAGSLDRARAELEASIALRGALADRSGTVAGRRALALVADRSGALVPGGRTPSGEEVPAARYEESASPPGGVPAAVVPLLLPARPERAAVTSGDSTLVTNHSGSAGSGGRRGVLNGARRNVVAAGAGALLVAVLGTVVTLGATSGGEGSPDKVKSEQSANEGDGQDGLPADGPTQGSTERPGDPGFPAAPGTSGSPEPGESGERAAPGDPSTSGKPSDSPSDPSTPGKPPSSGPSKPPPGGGGSTRPPSSPPPSSPSTPPTTPSSPPPSSSSPPPTTTPPPPAEPGTSDSASAPVTSASMSSSGAPVSSGASGAGSVI